LCQEVFAPRDTPWWIADTLHVLKCQRTRLKNRIFLSPAVYVDAGVMNETLNLNVALTNFEGLAKMNDVLAVELFTIDNLEKLVVDGKMIEAYYLLPFVCWYTAIAVQGLSWETRLSLLEIAFFIFVDWYRQSRSLPAEFFGYRKFFVELIDLPRYLNTILFLYQITLRREPVAYNRLGTHSVENIFGLTRVSCHFHHTWPKFLRSSARAIVMDKVLRANRMKSHVRREFSIGGVKVFNGPEGGTKDIYVEFPEGGPNALIELLKRLIFPRVMSPDKPREREMDEAIIESWLEIFHNLKKWKNDGHLEKTYRPGPVAGQAILARLISFGKANPERKSVAPKPFAWTPKAKRYARRLHITHSDEEVAKLIDCPVEQVRKLWEKT
jgi:hypothetical protein